MLEKLENDFNEAQFIAKVNNIFVLMMNSIMFKDITRVSSSLSEEMRVKIKEKINNLEGRNIIQMYDELNVKDAKITNVEVLNDKYQIKVKLTSRYLDYCLDSQTKKLVSGNNETRIEVTNYLILEEPINHKQLIDVTRCPSCGANIDYNYTGVCEYCKSEMPKSEYDWILTDWQEVK